MSPNPPFQEHDIVHQSFAVIDREIGPHGFSSAAYSVLRRIIHATADFEYVSLLKLSDGAIESAIAALRSGTPLITDVGMVTQGIQRVAARTFRPQIVTALHQVDQALPGRTVTESGLLACCQNYPHGIYIIGNAPTALLALCEQIRQGRVSPALVIGAPVGFINVLEAKQALVKSAVPHIRIEGRKGGSGVAAAITNALLIWAWQQTATEA
ncbi:MAG: precorrin-8X methylmutase [Cyanobacteria bacterium J06648_16]